MQNSNLYRVVTFKKDDCDWKLNNIGYTPRLSYGKKTTNVEPTAKIGTYKLFIDRSTNKLDVNGKLIFENDIVEDETKARFFVKRGNIDQRFKYMNVSSGECLDQLEVDDRVWKVVNNLYLTKQ